MTPREALIACLAREQAPHDDDELADLIGDVDAILTGPLADPVIVAQLTTVLGPFDPDEMRAAGWVRADAAELVGLREQLARQAPVIEAAEVWLAAYDNELYAPAVDERLADAMNEYLTVRALSVPAPPEAPRYPNGVVVYDFANDDETQFIPAPPTEDEAP